MCHMLPEGPVTDQSRPRIPASVKHWHLRSGVELSSHQSEKRDEINSTVSKDKMLYPEGRKAFWDGS